MATLLDDTEGTGIMVKEPYEEEVVGINEDPETDSFEHHESQSGLHYNSPISDDSQHDSQHDSQVETTSSSSSGSDDDGIEYSIVTAPPYDAAQTPHFTRAIVLVVASNTEWNTGFVVESPLGGGQHVVVTTAELFLTRDLQPVYTCWIVAGAGTNKVEYRYGAWPHFEWPDMCNCVGFGRRLVYIPLNACFKTVKPLRLREPPCPCVDMPVRVYGFVDNNHPTWRDASVLQRPCGTLGMGVSTITYDKHQAVATGDYNTPCDGFRVPGAVGGPVMDEEGYVVAASIGTQRAAPMTLFALGDKNYYGCWFRRDHILPPEFYDLIPRHDDDCLVCEGKGEVTEVHEFFTF
ncbi:hypothetical protein QBC43DRAFT_67759 [Cladorrhinum sp. PSN259]|nr:hypothetical protein QBC43DRAFT_67759 [Cladorrhinum sp. PSN259]